MAYEKQVWTGREGHGLNKFTKTQETETTVYLTNTPDEITEEGTPFSAERMNHIEQGIEDAHKAGGGTKMHFVQESSSIEDFVREHQAKDGDIVVYVRRTASQSDHVTITSGPQSFSLYSKYFYKYHENPYSLESLGGMFPQMILPGGGITARGNGLDVLLRSDLDKIGVGNGQFAEIGTYLLAHTPAIHCVNEGVTVHMSAPSEGTCTAQSPARYLVNRDHISGMSATFSIPLPGRWEVVGQTSGTQDMVGGNAVFYVLVRRVQ